MTSSTRNSNLNRDRRSGRFCSRGLPSIAKQQHVQRQKIYLQNLKELKKRIHEEYLHIFCVSGTRKDQLPVSRSSSPLLRVFKLLIKEEYRLGSNLQLQGIRAYCARSLALVGENMPPSWHNEKTSAQSRFCKGFRLPCITRDTEMGKVKHWLQWAFSEDVLAVSSVNEGMSVCQEAIVEYCTGPRAETRPDRTLLASLNPNHQTMQKFCPNCECDSCKASQASSEGNSLGTNDAEGSAEQNFGCEQERPNSSMSRASNGETGSDGGQADQNCSPEDERKMKLRRELLESAKDDVTYVMLCLLFDDTMELEFGCFSGVYFNEFRRRDVEPPRMLKEVFLYSRHKRFCNTATTEHSQREKNLRCTLLLLEKARLSLRLPIYQDMKWSFASSLLAEHRNGPRNDGSSARSAQGRDNQS